MSAVAEIGEIREGFRTSCGYTMSRRVYDHFQAAYGDLNPLHVEDEFARRHGFPGRVMYGMILNGFISHFLSVHFPGGPVLLHEVNTQFKTPCHLGDEIRIDAEVAQVVGALRVVKMQMVIVNVTRERIAAKSRVQFGLL